MGIRHQLFAARQIYDGINGRTSDTQGHPGVRHQKEWRKTIEDAGALRAFGETPALCKRDKNLLYCKIVTSGAGETSRMPGVENPARCWGKQHDANFRPLRGQLAWFAPLEDDTSPGDERGVLTAAAEPVSTRDAIAAVYELRTPHWHDLTGKGEIARATQPLGDRGRQERAGKTPRRRDHGAPADRPVHPRKFFHHSDLCHGIELKPPVGVWHRHAERA